MLTDFKALLTIYRRLIGLIDEDLNFHHEQTAYIAYQVAREMGLDDEDLFLAVNAAFMHDIGSVVVPDAKRLMLAERGRLHVASVGAYVLSDIEGFERIAGVIEACQDRSRDTIAEIVHLASFVSASLTEGVPVLNQVPGIVDAVTRRRGHDFMEEVVDAFMRVSRVECLWMDASIHPGVVLSLMGPQRQVAHDQLTERFSRLIARIIDFRSPFTCMHSAGVAVAARELARLCHMSEEEVQMMWVAGSLHDIGKVKIPNAILDKPARLTDEEFNTIKEHAYYTAMVLEGVTGFEWISDWASFHHEKLNGAGYPFHLAADRLDVGARIMAVADIFSAITEVRPYRDGMDRTAAMAVLDEGVERGELDGDIVDVLRDNYDAVDELRERESRLVGSHYYRYVELLRQGLQADDPA